MVVVGVGVGVEVEVGIEVGVGVGVGVGVIVVVVVVVGVGVWVLLVPQKGECMHVFKVVGFAKDARVYEPKGGGKLYSRGHVVVFSKSMGEGSPKEFGGGPTKDKDGKERSFGPTEGWITIDGKEPLQKSTDERKYLYTVDKDQLSGKVKDGVLYWRVKGQVKNYETSEPVDLGGKDAPTGGTNAPTMSTTKIEKQLDDIHASLIQILGALTTKKEAPRSPEPQTGPAAEFNMPSREELPDDSDIPF